MAEYKTISDIKLDKLEQQLELQIQINQKLLEVIKMIEPFYKERYAEINKLIESQKEPKDKSNINIDNLNGSKITITESLLKNFDLHSYDNLVNQILNDNNYINKEVVLNYLYETKNMYLDESKQYEDINLDNIDSRQHSMSYTHGLLSGLELAIRFVNMYSK